MAGFYVHIPFCRKVCYYCDFHFTASLKNKDAMVNALCKEIIMRKDEWEGTEFDTIYLGGGTPTVLSADELVKISETIFRHYKIKPSVEFTLEANPDDLSELYLAELVRKTTINRLSIGVQSFIDRDLTLVNRRHNGSEAIQSVKSAQKAGFENITIDLIYGIPGMSLKDWKENLNRYFELEIPHLSAYHLSIEPKTVFGVWNKKGKFYPVDEELSKEQYNYLVEKMSKEGYEHYEISNFAKPGRYSKHNTSYWQNVPYIGVGPSAHSYNGEKRRWNLANNSRYISLIEEQSSEYFEEEILEVRDKFNDYILTSLRTCWGLDIDYIGAEFGVMFLNHVLHVSKKYSDSLMKQSTGKLRILEGSWLVSDSILADFMFV